MKAQGTSVYISTLTLTAIGIDRYFVIIFPFKPRMKLTTCLGIITLIWLFSFLLLYHMEYFRIQETGRWIYICVETWPSEEIRQVFSATTAVLQFVLPFIIILYAILECH